MRMKNVRYLAVGFLIFLAFLPRLQACECWPDPPAFYPDRVVERSSAVFVGIVSGIEEIRPGLFSWPLAAWELYGASRNRVFFQVSGAWKGIPTSSIVLTTGLGGGDCGFPFRIGHEYLVVAFTDDSWPGHPLTAGICSGTAEAGDAVDAIGSLRRWHSPRTFAVER